MRGGYDCKRGGCADKPPLAAGAAGEGRDGGEHADEKKAARKVP